MAWASVYRAHTQRAEINRVEADIAKEGRGDVFAAQLVARYSMLGGVVSSLNKLDLPL